MIVDNYPRLQVRFPHGCNWSFSYLVLFMNICVCLLLFPSINTANSHVHGGKACTVRGLCLKELWPAFKIDDGGSGL